MIEYILSIICDYWWLILSMGVVYALIRLGTNSVKEYESLEEHYDNGVIKDESEKPVSNN